MSKRTQTKERAEDEHHVLPRDQPNIPMPAVKPPLGARAPAVIEPVNFLQVIKTAAADPNCDVAKMRELLNMQKEIAAEESRISFMTDFIAMQPKLPVIDAKGRIIIKPKEGARTQKVQKTPYATFDEIHTVCTPILTAHGFVMWTETDHLAGVGIFVCVHLGHKNGHIRTSRFPLPLDVGGSKSNVQAVGSSISYGRRYGAMTLLNLNSRAPHDRDIDGNKPEEIEQVDDQPTRLTDEQVKTLRAAMEFAGLDDERLCTVYSKIAKIDIAKMEDLPPALYDRAIKSCKDFAAQAASERKS